MRRWFESNGLRLESPRARYAVAMIATASVAVLRWLLDPLFGGSTEYLLFYFSVMLAAVTGGLRAGLLAIVLGAVAGAWLYDHLGHAGDWTDEILRLALFVLFSGATVTLAVRLRAAQRQAADRARELASAAQFPAENPHPVLRIGREGQVLYANKASEELMIGEGWNHSGVAAPTLRDPSASALESGRQCEFEITCRDQRTLAFLCVPLVQKGYVNLYGRDVTETRRVESVLRQSEQRYRLLFDRNPDGVFTVNTAGGFILVNPACESLCGYAAAELLQKTFMELCAPDRLADTIAHFERALVDRTYLELETALIRKDGRRVELWIAGETIVSEEQVVAVHCTVKDITERKRAEEELRRSEARLQTTLEHLAEGVVISDLEGNLVHWNRATLTMHELASQEEYHGRLPDFADTFELSTRDGIVLPVEQWPVARILRGESLRDWEVHIRRVKGDWQRIFSYSGSLACDRYGKPLLAVLSINDVTERRRSEEDLEVARQSAEQAQAAAEQANRAKDDFLAVLSHELRTPLMPVAMGVSMLEDRPDLDPTMRETLEMIRRNVEMEARLIDDLLDVARISRGKIELERTPVELCTVIQRAVEVCKPDIQARGVHFGVDLGPAVPYWIEADVPRLQQVFWNLLKNAIKFTPESGCIGIRCRRDENRVLVEVNDSGIGIEPESLPSVFNAFEQVEEAKSRQFGGLGLGLAISKALVDMHGGTISAHSEGRDKGATFRIRLPLTRPDGKFGGPTQPATPRAVRPLRILLVEDHSVTAMMVTMVLTAAGHSVETSGDVATALELASHHTFDLLISDIGLPDGNGHDLLRELRRRGHKFPGIALTGYGQESDITRSHQTGFAAHLTKPASREAIFDAIATVTAGDNGQGIPANHQP